VNKTKIDYADYSWNPVYGCRNGCPYCYARRYCERFGKSFEPHWVQKNFDRPMPKEPSIIFVNSMSDICWWDGVWIEQVISQCASNPQHIFLFLTKDPTVYYNTQFRILENVWYGFTATNNDEVMNRQVHMYDFDQVWCSAEPLLGAIESLDDHLVKWLVVGAMTGAGATPVREDWVGAAFQYDGCSIFAKDNMPAWTWEIYDRSILREYPPEMLRHLGRDST